MTTHVEHCTGTVFSLRFAATDLPDAAVRDVLTWLHATDALFSTYRPDSQIRRLDAGTLRPEDAAPEVRHVLRACARLAERTDGSFSARPNGTDLDPSGYVKGWAVQHACDMLTAACSRTHCVNGGGDVAAAGSPDGRPGWRTGIGDPHRPGALVDVVEAPGPIAVATSGSAERGAHIYDPRTGRPATELSAVTVTVSDLVTADTYATAAVAMGTRRALDWLRAQEAIGALLITADRVVRRIGSWPTAGVRYPAGRPPIDGPCPRPHE